MGVLESKNMRQATSGDSVRVHYTVTLDDGTEIDSSAKGEPVNLTIGNEQFFPGVESALMGMAEGDTKKVTLEPENTFGAHNPELIQNIKREFIQPEVKLEIGTVLKIKTENGEGAPVMVVEFSDNNVTLDTNHPLVGEALTFELTLVEFVG